MQTEIFILALIFVTAMNSILFFENLYPFFTQIVLMQLINWEKFMVKYFVFLTFVPEVSQTVFVWKCMEILSASLWKCFFFKESKTHLRAIF